jgi:pyruvate kinase
MIQKCLAVAKPVIVATQMLDSMTHNVRPTRAEVSDVANAVIDHTDAIMLSAETASGEFPVETVTTMAKIASKTEASTFDDLEVKPSGKKNEPLDDAVSELARLAADKLGAKAILAASISGASGRHISRFRPELPIYVPTDTERVCHQLNLSWGVRSFILPACRTIEELVERSMSYLKKNKELKKGDRVILVAGEPVGQAGNVNLIEVKEVR